MSVITPTDFETFRADTISATVDILRACQTANPTKLRQVRTARPSSVSETPCAYLGRRPGNVLQFDSGTRAQNLGVEVVLVDSLSDNEETLGRLDALADLLLEWFTVNPHAAGGTRLLQVAQIEDGEEEYGTNVRYETVTLRLASTSGVGRS